MWSNPYCALTCKITSSQMQETVRIFQSCLCRPPTDQMATLAFCCSFSQGQAVEVSLPHLCSHLYWCSVPLRASRLLVRCLPKFSLLWSTCSIKASFFVFFFHTPFFAPSTSLLRRCFHYSWVCPPWRRRLPYGKVSSFSYANLTLQSRWCSPGIQQTSLHTLLHT